MGWWSEKIMGGDSPLDIEIEMKEAKLNFTNITVGQFESFLRISGNRSFRNQNERRIAWQVLGYKILQHGGLIDRKVLMEIVRNINEEPLDGWGDNAGSRELKLKKFIFILRDNLLSALANTVSNSSMYLKSTESIALGQEILAMDFTTRQYKKAWTKTQEVRDVYKHKFINTKEMNWLIDLIEARIAQVEINKELIKKYDI